MGTGHCGKSYGRDSAGCIYHNSDFNSEKSKKDLLEKPFPGTGDRIVYCRNVVDLRYLSIQTGGTETEIFHRILGSSGSFKKRNLR